MGVNFTAGEAWPVAGIVAEPLEELLDELEDPEEDPLGLDDELFEVPDEELAVAPLGELDDDPVELDDPVEPDDELAGVPLDELELDPFELEEPVEPDEELAGAPLEELDDCEVGPEEDKAFDTTRSCPLLADAPLEFELPDPELLLELLEPELPDPELADPELLEELLVVTTTATQFPGIWLSDPEGILTC